LTAPAQQVVRALRIVQGVLVAGERTTAMPKTSSTWPNLQKMLRSDDFLMRVRGFRVQNSGLMEEAIVARLRAEIEGKQAGNIRVPLNDAAVRRTSQAVAQLFTWACAQLNLAPLVRQAEASKASGATAVVDKQLAAAEGARARLATARLLADVRASAALDALLAPMDMIEAIHSTEQGPLAVAALQERLKSAEVALCELRQRCVAKDEELGGIRQHLDGIKLESCALEKKLDDAKKVHAGPPICDCSLEMVSRQIGDMGSMDYGRTYWRCPDLRFGCGRRQFDDTVPVNREVPRRFSG